MRLPIEFRVLRKPGIELPFNNNDILIRRIRFAIYIIAEEKEFTAGNISSGMVSIEKEKVKNCAYHFLHSISFIPIRANVMARIPKIRDTAIAHFRSSRYNHRVRTLYG
jgi:hypothetical protein